MTQETADVGIEAFKKAAVDNPKGIFEQIRNNGNPELAYLVILFCDLEAEWHKKKSSAITGKKLACLAELFLTPDYRLALNISFDELSSKTFDMNLHKAFSLPKPQYYAFNSKTTNNHETTASGVYIFNQILAYFYPELQQLYKRYLSKQKKKPAPLTKRVSLEIDTGYFINAASSTHDSTLFAPMTPRFYNADKQVRSDNFINVIPPQYIKRIQVRLTKAGFDTAKYHLTEFQQKTTCLPTCHIL